MPMPVIETPWVLLLLPLCISPWLAEKRRRLRHSSLMFLPPDPLSLRLDRMLRLTGIMGLFCLITGLSGPYLQQQDRRISAHGAEIVLLLDRSSSMNENFSGRYLGGRASETKNAQARKLLLTFTASRPNDLFAMVAFSAAPLYIMPLTPDREAIVAAIQGAADRGHGVTNIGAGIIKALDLFSIDTAQRQNSRAIILISDGAARIETETQALIQQGFKQAGVQLYWLFLRNRLSAHLDSAMPANQESAPPEQLLHHFFQSIGTPYRGFEADNPEAVQAALDVITGIEQQPLSYPVKQPRSDLSGLFGLLACILLLPTCLLPWMEIDYP